MFLYGKVTLQFLNNSPVCYQYGKIRTALNIKHRKQLDEVSLQRIDGGK